MSIGLTGLGDGSRRVRLSLLKRPSAFFIRVLRGCTGNNIPKRRIVVHCVVVIVIVLLIPTVGLSKLARDQVHGHLSRVKMQGTFKTAHSKLL